MIDKQDDGTIKVTFDKPVTIDGTAVSVLVMREPLVSDQLNAQDGTASEAAAEVALIANLCEISPENVRGMTLRAFTQLREALGLFFA